MRTFLVLTAVCLSAPAVVAAQQPVDPSYFAGMRWRNIGPNRSGYISSVAGIPGDPTTYYVGTPEGGVWKSVSGGTTWHPIFDDMHVPSIGAVAVAPSSPNIVYVGTGNQSGWSFTSGNGMYKSTDAGKSWTHIGLPGSGYINTIVINPSNPDVVLVAALGSRDSGAVVEQGVYRTTNGGRNWTHVLPADGAGGATELNFDYYDPAIVYATITGGGGGRGAPLPAPAAGAAASGIYKSVDGGITWKPIGTQGLPASSGAFAVASGTHGQRLYMEVRGGARGAAVPGQARSGIYRSDDGGNSWTLGTSQIASAGGHIYADPKNPDVVYLMGTSMYRSVDGARHFESYMGAPSGADIRMLWIDATNSRRMLAGADQGPTISVDNGETWTPWYNMIDGQFYRVSTDNDFPYHVCGPQQDSGTACVLSRSDFGEVRPNDWYPAGGFENGFIVADPLNSRFVYTQGWYHVLRRFDRVTSQVSVLYTPSTEDRFGSAPPLAFSPQDSHMLYMGAQYVLASSDNAQTWHKVSPDLTARAQPVDTAVPGRRSGPVVGGGSLQALAPSSVGAGVIWTGAGNGLVNLTRDGGKSWHDVTPRDIAPGAINILDAGHHDAAVAYIAVLSRDNHPHIYRTTNFGESWQQIVNGIADGAVVRVVREDPVDPNLLYAGTVTSAYVSFDKGDHWQSLQLNLPNTVISDMTVHGSDLVISTYGRGFWILDDVTPLRQMREATAGALGAFLFRPDTASRIRWDNTQDTPLAVEVTVGQNPPEGAIIDYYLKGAATGPITLTISDLAGHVVREFSDVAPPADTLMPNVPAYWLQAPTVMSKAPGMHRIAWDLRYATPPSLPFGYTGTLLDYVEFTLNWHAIPGQTPSLQPVGPLVVPGTYNATLKVAGKSYAVRLVVIADPRVGVPQAALEAQLQLMQHMVAGLGTSNEGFTQLSRLRAALAALPAQVAGKTGASEITAAAQSLDASLPALITGPRGFGPSNRDLARRLTDMEYGDVQPSPSVIDAAETNCRDIDATVAAARQLQTTNVASLNALLATAQLRPLPATTLPAGNACGPRGAP